MKKAISIIIIIVLLGAIGGLAYLFISNNSSVKVPDFSSSNVTEVQEWCEGLENYGCTINYEYNDTVGENMVVYQSIKADEKLESDITFIISKGIEPVTITAPAITDATTKADIETWAETNGLNNVVYEEENSDTVAENNVIRIESSDSPLTVNSYITVYISSGKAADSKTDTSEDGIVVESGTYVGLTLEQFKTKTEALKLVATHKESRDAYSSTVAKGDIVWHGSGTYEENEAISYGLSLGKSDSEEDLTITKGEYVGLTETAFKEKASTLKLSANHQTSRDAYSDTVTKGNVVWHGSGTYVENETWNYGLSLGKEDDSSTTSDDLEILRTEYLGLTEDAFKAKATELKLVANHKSSKDAYSDTVTKGNIVWHGYGDYVEGETWNYGLSLGKESDSSSSSSSTSTTTRTTSITVTKGSYVGLSVSEFETKMKALGFESIVKTTDHQDYSDTIAAGYVIWHGSGTYSTSETSIRYSVSLGPKAGEVIDNPTTEKVTVDGSAYIGKSASELSTYCTGLGLVAKNSSSYDNYSSTVAAGKVLTYDSGSITKGSTVYYGLSKGIKTASLLSLTDMNNVWIQNPTSVSATKSILTSKLSEFTNVTYEEASSTGKSAGVILSVTVNGNTHSSSATYAVDAKIVITICNGYA